MSFMSFSVVSYSHNKIYCSKNSSNSSFRYNYDDDISSSNFVMRPTSKRSADLQYGARLTVWSQKQWLAEIDDAWVTTV